MLERKLQTLPVVAIGLSLTTGCGSGLEGVWSAAEVFVNGEDVTDTYTYTYTYDGCSYTFDLRMMISDRLTGFFFWYYSYQGCADNDDNHVGGYGYYITVEKQSQGVYHLYNEDYNGGQAWMYCESGGDLKCKTIPDNGAIQIRFTRL